MAASIRRRRRQLPRGRRRCAGRRHSGVLRRAGEVRRQHQGAARMNARPAGPRRLADVAEDKARVAAWDRLSAMLNALDSKTSALLRFNAIVVAALAYLVVVAGADPFAQAQADHQDDGLCGRPCQPGAERRELRLRLSGDQRGARVLRCGRPGIDEGLSSCGWAPWWRIARASMPGRGGSRSRADWASPFWSRWRPFTESWERPWPDPI